MLPRTITIPIEEEIRSLINRLAALERVLLAAVQVEAAPRVAAHLNALGGALRSLLRLDANWTAELVASAMLQVGPFRVSLELVGRANLNVLRDYVRNNFEAFWSGLVVIITEGVAGIELAVGQFVGKLISRLNQKIEELWEELHAKFGRGLVEGSHNLGVVDFSRSAAGKLTLNHRLRRGSQFVSVWSVEVEP